MEENKQMLELLERMEKNSRRQTRLGMIQCAFSLIAAVFCAGVFLLIFRILPQISQILPQIDTVLSQLQTVLSNLETTTEQLASFDMGGMVSDVDALVVSAQQSLQQTMEKLNTIDLKTLNKAIADLADVVEPLSKVAKMFG